jgi:hypothetical protein
MLRRNSEPISGYRRTTMAVAAVSDRRNSIGRSSRKSGADEINDRPVRHGGRTEFGLPPSHYEGRFGNEAPFAFVPYGWADSFT